MIETKKIYSQQRDKKRERVRKANSEATTPAETTTTTQTGTLIYKCQINFLLFHHAHLCESVCVCLFTIYTMLGLCNAELFCFILACSGTHCLCILGHICYMGLSVVCILKDSRALRSIFQRYHKIHRIFHFINNINIGFGGARAQPFFVHLPFLLALSRSPLPFVLFAGCISLRSWCVCYSM